MKSKDILSDETKAIYDYIVGNVLNKEIVVLADLLNKYIENGETFDLYDDDTTSCLEVDFIKNNNF